MKCCYNCGSYVVRKHKDREHRETDEDIPARNLYVDYKNRLQNSIIKIPSCDICNNKFSKIDHVIRDILAVSSNIIAEEEIKNKSARAVLKNNKRASNLLFDDKGLLGEIMNCKDISLVNKKNFSGIFYQEYQIPIINVLGKEVNISEISFSFDPNITIENCYDKEKVKKAKDIWRICNRKNQWKISGHENIFRYVIIKEFLNNKESYIGVLEYGKKLISILIAPEIRK